MEQYISKSALVAEIEKLKLCTMDEHMNFYSEAAEGEYHALSNLESFIDTLEVKEVENFIWNNARTTVPEDSTNQIICIKEDGLAVSTIGKIVNGTVKWAYLDDLLNTNSFNAEVKEIDLEKEVENWVKTGPHTSYPWCTIPDAIRITAEHFFELGLKVQKGE